ncbi:LCP family protein [Vallitaleaceae bacterium 9-2]
MAKKRKNRHIYLINKFIKIFFVSFVLLIIVASLGTYGYVQITSNKILEALKNNPITVNGTDDGIDEVLSEEDASHIVAKELTTVAIFGVDEDGYRTDVNMIAFFNHKLGDIDIISIPRDTKVRIPDDIYSEITKVRSDVKQYSRINAIPAYVSSKKRNDTSVEVLEQVFGVKIDYYVNMNLEGFKYIVDAVGPIYMDIPKPLKYSDPLQNLYINLDAGYQPLNGAQAEQLVRYRKGYANADIGRIDMQHEFMKAFMEQVLEPDKKFNMVTILETIFNHVTTNFTDAVDYLIYIDDISADKISMTTLPGAGSKTDGSYEYDQAASKELIEGIINKKEVVPVPENQNADGQEATNDEGTQEPEVEIEVDPIEILDPTEFAISVQNATNISGLAGRTKERLKTIGFDVVDASNYKDKSLKQTIIIAPVQEVGEALETHFNNPKITIDESLMDKEIQVIIAVGANDSDQ